ncbi:protein kinase family protein, partial [Nocardiopsis flavescens]|uniref:WD40 repeat domain-containing protein n=2 Tax=Nocardiopsis flavescens TaxID=758803 RepID=UPI00365F79C9
AAGLADLHAAGVAAGPLRAEGVLTPPGGAVLAEAVCAEPSAGPAQDVRHWADLMTAVAGDAGVPPRLRTLVEGCAHPDPALRPSARELVRMLEGADPAPETGGGPAAGRRPGGRVLAAATAGVLAVAAVAATAFVAAREDRAEPSGAPGAAVADCTGAQGFAPDGERSLEDAEVFSHLRFSPDGDLLAMHTLEDELSVWDWREDREVARPDVEVSRLGGLAFVPGGCEIATVVMEPEPRPGDEYPTPVGQVLDLASGTAADHGVRGMAGGPSPGPPPGATGIAVSPEGLIALSGLDAGTRTQIVDGGTGEAVTTFETPGGTPVFLDERRLLLGAFGGSAEEHVTLWDVRTGERLHTIRPVADAVFAPVPGTDQVVYAHGGEVVVWDVAAGERVDAFDMEDAGELRAPWVREIVVDPWLGRVYVMWWDSDPRDYEAEADSYSGAWDLESGENLLPRDQELWHVAPHPSGEVVAVTAQDTGVRLLDPHTWEPVETP